MIIEEQVRAATCQVRCGGEVGTGWLLSPELIVTAKHCVLPATVEGEKATIVAEFGLGSEAKEYPATIVHLSPDLDVAVLQLAESLEIMPLKLALGLPRPGSRWISYGRPISKIDIGHRLEGSISQLLDGLPSAIDFEVAVDNGSWLEEYDGYSGAAVVTEDGCVGLLTTTADRAIGGISVVRIESFLQRATAPSTETAAAESAPPAGPYLAPRENFQTAFEAALLSEGRRFIFLEGVPGIGKSTFCAEFTPESDRLEFLGIYSFSSRKGGYNAAYWAQPEVFEDWLRVLHASTVSGAPPRMSQLTYPEMIRSVNESLSALAERYAAQGKIAVLFLDGLNEAVLADSQAYRRLIGLLPATTPTGLVIVLASVSYDAVQSSLGGRVTADGRISLPSLPRESVAQVCQEELVPEISTPSLIAQICDRAAGHPLYLRYLIDLINRGGAPADIETLPTFSGDIEDYYESIWFSVAADADAVQALATMVRLRWGISVEEFLSFLDPSGRIAFGATLPKIRHLLEDTSGTAVYHRSFAQFIVSKTTLSDRDYHDRLRQRFTEIPESPYSTLNRVFHDVRGGPASQARALEDCKQAWVDSCVLLGVSPDALLDDVDSALAIATGLGNPVATVGLLLLSQRVRHRYNILFTRHAHLAARAMAALGQTEDALRFSMRQGGLLLPMGDLLFVARALASSGNADAAYEMLDRADVLVLEGLEGETSASGFLDLAGIRAHILLLMAAMGRDSTQGDLSSFIQAVKRRIRHGMTGPAEVRDEVLGDVDGQFVALMLHFGERSSEWLETLPEGIRDELLGSTRRLTSVLESYRSLLSIYGDRIGPNRLTGVVSRIEAAVRNGDLPHEPLRLRVADSLVLAGGAVDVVAALCEGMLPTESLKLEFFKQNRALIDGPAFFRAYEFQRLKAYGPSSGIVLSAGSIDPNNWQASLATVANDLARCDGIARAAKLDSAATTTLASVWVVIESRVLAPLRFTLGERVRWEGSYNVPEAIIPAIYKLLAQLCVDCLPDRLADLLSFLEDNLLRQCGLYTEGFRASMTGVFEQICTAPVLPALRIRAVALAARWKTYVLRTVQNRTELVPELLSIIPIFVKLGATEEAMRTYQAVLANSMGPNWYKEGQFSLMVDTLRSFPAGEALGTEVLPRIERYLDAASGELTFQRFVRYAKHDYLGELCRRGRHLSAARTFTHQMCGPQAVLYAQATEGEQDRVSPLVGMRFPGRTLDEQAAIIELVEGSMDAACWQISWALLEIFQSGEDRHLERWGRVYARLVNRCEHDEASLAETSIRMRDISMRRYDRGDFEKLRKSFMETLHPQLAGYFPSFDAGVSGEVLPSDSESTAPETDASGQEDTAGEARTPSDEDLDALYLPGTFGKSASVRSAEAALARADAAQAILNAGEACREAVGVLRELQAGGWSIWHDSTSHAGRAEAIIDSVATSPIEITRLYAPLILEERHEYRWSIAKKFIERIGGKLNEAERDALSQEVLVHTQLLIGDAGNTETSIPSALGEESTAEHALFVLLMWSLDHPKHERRQVASQLTLWAANHVDCILGFIVRKAFSMDADNASDVASGVLDVLSRSSPAESWERMQAHLDVPAISRTCKHAGRYAVLFRVLRRAIQAGAGAASVQLEEAERGLSSRVTASPGNLAIGSQATPADFYGAMQGEWSELTQLGLVNTAVLDKADRVMKELCAPLEPGTVRELEDLVAQGFETKRVARFGRWESKTRFALQRALFDTVPVQDLEKAEQILRIYNPESLHRPEGARFPLLRFLEAEGTRWRRFQPRDGNRVYLCVQALVEGRRGPLLVELISFLKPGGAGFAYPPAMEPSFKSTQLPRPAPSDPAVLVATVDPTVAYFGGLTPAILQPQFVKHLGIRNADVQRSFWTDWLDSEGDKGVYVNECSSLAVASEALKIPDGFRLAWLVKIDGRVQATIDA